jgi:hypothetical protein
VELFLDGLCFSLVSTNKPHRVTNILLFYIYYQKFRLDLIPDTLDMYIPSLVSLIINLQYNLSNILRTGSSAPTER